MDDGIWRIILGDPLEVLQYHTIWNLISLNQQISSIARLEAVLRLFWWQVLTFLRIILGDPLGKYVTFEVDTIVQLIQVYIHYHEKVKYA